MGRSKKNAGKRGAAPQIHANDLEADTPATIAAVTVVVFIAHCYIYMATAYPSVPGGDSGELIAVANVLGVAHPPGYPLFTMATKAVIEALPCGSVAWRANILSSAMAAGAGAFLFLASSILSGTMAAGFTSLAVFSFCRLTWMYSVGAEVFAFNNFFVALLLYILIKFVRADDDSRDKTFWAYAGALFSGIGLTNQHTVVLYLVVIVPYVLWVARKQLMSAQSLTALTLCFMIGISPYIYIPLRALQTDAPLTWGDQRTVGGFLKHLLRQEYGTFSLAKGDQNTPFLVALWAHLSSFTAETFVIGSILTIGGVLVPWRRTPKAKLPLIGMLIFYLGFFNWRANLDLNNPLLAGVQERFWMQPNLVFALLAGAGYQYLGALVTKSKTVLVAVAILLCSVQLGVNFNMRDESHNTAVADFGKAMIENLPTDSIMLTLGDLPGNAARYVHLCDGVRPDLHLIDLEMATMDWYHDMVGHSFPGVTFPGEKKTYRIGPEFYNMKEFFDANIDQHDIFVFESLNADDNSWQCCYEVKPFGLVYKIVKKNATLDERYVELSLNNIPDITLPDADKYDERTWERVVRDGILASGIHLGLLFERTARTSSREEAIRLGHAALKAYDIMFSRYPDHPDFWYKNAGLAAYQLYQKSDDVKVAEQAVAHWSIYTKRAVTDNQIETIKGIIRELKGVIKQQDW